MNDREVNRELFNILESEGLSAAIQFCDVRSLEKLYLKGVKIDRTIEEFVAKNSLHEVKHAASKIRSLCLYLKQSQKKK